MEVKERDKAMKYEKKSFSRNYYEDMWSFYEDCKNIVNKEWAVFGGKSKANPVQQFQKIAKSSLANLKTWSNSEFKDREKQQNKLLEQLKVAKQSSGHAIDGMQIKKLENQISNMLMDEEIYWKQRSRVKWLKEGDRNTKFFHEKASARRRKNKIWGVEDNNGKWLKDQDDINREFSEFFQDLFTTSNPSYAQIQEVVLELQPKVTSEMNY